MKQYDVSIIIATHTTKEITESCLQSLKEDESLLLREYIIIDNASTDDTKAMVERILPNAVYIYNKDNLGYAKANNQGMRLAKGKYILLLNSDTEVKPHTIDQMVEFMNTDKKIGVSTCFVQLSDGSIDPACHRGFPTPWAAFTYFSGLERIFPKMKWASHYHEWYKDMKKPHEIDCPTGAFWLMRKEVVETVGLLDEQFFMYGEDIDYAYRIKQKGWTIWFNPVVRILHKKKMSGRSHSEKEKRRRMNGYFYDTMKLFYQKHYEKKYGWLVSQIMYLAISIKKILGR